MFKFFGLIQEPGTGPRHLPTYLLDHDPMHAGPTLVRVTVHATPTCDGHGLHCASLVYQRGDFFSYKGSMRRM